MAALAAMASTLWAQPAAGDREGDGVNTVESLVTRERGPLVAAPPARFAGWFQPWIVALLVGLPVVAAFVERRRDMLRWLRRRDWKRRGTDDDD
jgi:hypothetical protein